MDFDHIRIRTYFKYRIQIRPKHPDLAEPDPQPWASSGLIIKIQNTSRIMLALLSIFVE